MRCKPLLPELLIAILVGVTGLAFGTRAKAGLDQVGNQVMCLCGCTMTLNHCPHLISQCQSRAEVTAAILQDIKKGKNDPEILQDLSARFGTQVLAAPPARGFDLAAWILPGAGLVIGLIVVILIVRRLRGEPPSAPPREPLPVDAKIMAAVEEEMDRIVPLRE
jgi:cytochrome c-type biogenesis protein CcmH/NrfF